MLEALELTALVPGPDPFVASGDGDGDAGGDEGAELALDLGAAARAAAAATVNDWLAGAAGA